MRYVYNKTKAAILDEPVSGLSRLSWALLVKMSGGAAIAQVQFVYILLLKFS